MAERIFWPIDIESSFNALMSDGKKKITHT